jgi:23S rRNA (adenine2503-C2)-methyltransferase
MTKLKSVKSSFYQMSYPDLVSFLETEGLEISGASKLFNWHYKKKLAAPCDMKVAKSSLAKIFETFDFKLPEISEVSESSDKTVKFLFKLKDGSTVESVLIPFYKKYSLCVSSQVGCGMNCSFCFTGTQGFKRHLETHEIVGQFLASWNWLKENRPLEVNITNLVFMGQGEPLHNFDAVRKACEIFLSQHGCSIAAQKITVSTSGYLPGLKRWKDEMPGVNLALSLHSPFKEKRDELIPINRKFDLKDVLLEIEDIPLAKKQFVTYEYLLIDDFNDTKKDAESLGELLIGKRAYINLIPFNPFPGSNYKKPGLAKVESFKAVLDRFKIPTLIRTTKGDEVLAACGQLKT